MDTCDLAQKVHKRLRLRLAYSGNDALAISVPVSEVEQILDLLVVLVRSEQERYA